MHTFRTRLDGYREVRNQFLFPLICVDVAIVVVEIYLHSGEASDPKAYARQILTSVIVIAALTISSVRAIRKQRKLYETFTLTITEDSITREQHNTPVITIDKNRVREIQKFSNGGIRVIGDSNLNAIGIPAQMEHREALERHLRDIKPLTVKPYGTGRAYLQTFGLILVFAIIGAGLLSENRIAISISGIVMCGFIVAGFVILQQGKDFDKKMKRLRYLTLIPFIGIISYVILSWIDGM